MPTTFAKGLAEELLKDAKIAINGTHPWDIIVHNENLYERALKDGSLGLGEGYIEGWWDCERLDQFFERVLEAGLQNKIKKNKRLLFKIILAKILNLQSKSRAFDVGKKHYDLGNNLFKAMLDSRMNYTCGYFKNARTLEEAQLAKLDLVCQKLSLLPGMRLLDIGCGFGALARYAAKNYGVSVVGITVSEQQQRYAIENCAGLPVEIRLQDYRELNEKFDRIASLGMFEHVGTKNYSTYMTIVHRCLADDGLFLLHTIGNNAFFPVDEWIEKYIFTNGVMPTIPLIANAFENLFVMEDWHNFGADYDKTLMAWHRNFIENWEKLKSDYDERFYRTWTYYLLLCAGGFRARTMQLWQIVLSKQGVRGGYQAPR